VIITWITVIFATDLVAQMVPGEALFFTANQAYQEGRFQDAVDNYEALLASGYRNGHIFYNTGNAYFRLGQLGRAILNYERARVAIPRDADLNFNLRQARDQLRDAVETDKDFVRVALFWLDYLNLKELFWIFAVINILFWGMLTVRLLRRSDWSYYCVLILLIAWVVSGLSFGVQYHRLAFDDRAVILEQEADILAGPDSKDTLLFKLHEGTMVHNERMEDGWSLIRLSDTQRGWIRADALGMIRSKQ
jgi:tetratricopeptide (TPR) repeat protein